MITHEMLEKAADRKVDGRWIFTNSFELALKPDPAPQIPLILQAQARCFGDEPATVGYTLKKGEHTIYRSMAYTFARRDEFSRHAWRVPPFVGGADTLVISVTIPEGETVEAAYFTAEASDARTPWSGGMRLNAHLGFHGLCPDNTMPAFELASACGYPACIVVPKGTKDGKLVCIHDDTINNTARDEAGNPPAEPMYVWDMTLEELRRWEYGSCRNSIWKGTAIPTLEEFFAFCARVQMRPMFSTHPALTGEQWLAPSG